MDPRRPRSGSAGRESSVPQAAWSRLGRSSGCSSTLRVTKPHAPARSTTIPPAIIVHTMGTNATGFEVS